MSDASNPFASLVSSGFGSTATSPWNLSTYQEGGTGANPVTEGDGYFNPYDGTIRQSPINLSQSFPSQYGPGGFVPSPSSTFDPTATGANFGGSGGQVTNPMPAPTGPGTLSGIPNAETGASVNPNPTVTPGGGDQYSLQFSKLGLSSDGKTPQGFPSFASDWQQNGDHYYSPSTGLVYWANSGAIGQWNPDASEGSQLGEIWNPGQDAPSWLQGLMGGGGGGGTEPPPGTQVPPVTGGHGGGDVRGFTPLITGSGDFKTVWPISGDITSAMGGYLGEHIGSGARPFNMSVGLPTGGQSSPGQMYAGINSYLQQIANFYRGGDPTNPQQKTLRNAMANGLTPSVDVINAGARGDLGIQDPDAISAAARGELNPNLPGVFSRGMNGELGTNLPSVFDKAMSGGLTPDNATVQQMAKDGSPVDQTQAWQSMVEAQQRNIQKSQANLNEQFAHQGLIGGSPWQQANVDFQSQTAKDQNALLAQMQSQAMESAAGRKLQAGESLLGAGSVGAQMALSAGQSTVGAKQFDVQTMMQAGEKSLGSQEFAAQLRTDASKVQAELKSKNADIAMSAGQTQAQLAAQGSQQMLQTAETVSSAYNDLAQLFQGMDQKAIDSVLQEFIRASPEYSPLLQYMYGFGTTFPPVVSAKWGMGASGGIMQGIGNMLSGMSKDSDK